MRIYNRIQQSCSYWET